MKPLDVSALKITSAIVAFQVVGIPTEAEVVEIPDPGLQRVIRAHLDKPDGDITRVDMGSMTELRTTSLLIESLEGIQTATNLESLDLQAPNLLGDDNRSPELWRIDFAPLGELPNLAKLNLNFNYFENLTLPPLPAGLSNLKELSVGATGITDYSFLEGMSSLTSLELGHNHHGGRLSLPPNLVHLEELGLSGANNFRNLVLPPVGLTTLRSLDLRFSNTLIRSLTLPQTLRSRVENGSLHIKGFDVTEVAYYDDAAPLGIGAVKLRPDREIELTIVGPPGEVLLQASDDLRDWKNLSRITKFAGDQAEIVPTVTNYGLSLRSVATPGELEFEAKSLVVVALIGGKLHIRIFDSDWEQVVDKPENKLLKGDEFTELMSFMKSLSVPEEYVSQGQDQKLIIDLATSVADYSLTDSSLGFFRLKELAGMDSVIVGHPGNAADSTGLGAVSRAFRIGKYEVTNAHYVEFLNAIARSDPNGLYNVNMGTDPRSGIRRFGETGKFEYEMKPNMVNKPVNYVSFWDACRFCNWLHNGKPSGLQDSTTTEDGAYDLTDTDAIASNTVTRKAGARFFLPSGDEWYKAAYHQPSELGGDSDHYWLYPTQSNERPVAATADKHGNVNNDTEHIANYSFAAEWNGQNGNVTTVGSGGPGNASFYGAFDMGGNVSEWTESILERDARFVKGSSWRERGASSEDDHSEGLRSNENVRFGLMTPTETSDLGFRIARP